MVNKVPSHQGPRMGMRKETDQTVQELSPRVLQTTGHRCEGDGLFWSWCIVLHVPDLPAERQSQGPKLKGKGQAGPREETGEGSGMGREGAGSGKRMPGTAYTTPELHPYHAGAGGRGSPVTEEGIPSCIASVPARSQPCKSAWTGRNRETLPTSQGKEGTMCSMNMYLI